MVLRELPKPLIYYLLQPGGRPEAWPAQGALHLPQAEPHQEGDQGGPAGW